jgi:histidinol-phosphatase
VFHADVSGRTEGVVPPRVPELFRSVERTRGFGDFYQHMLVAEGAGEAALDFKMQPWDIAALKVIVEEAGGRATSIAGEDTIYGGSLVSTNGSVHAAVATFLRAP